MKTSRLLINELKLLFKQKITLAMLGIFYVFMIAGIESINNSNEMMLHGMKRNTMTISYGSASYGCRIGILLFSICIVLNLSRDKRKQSFALLETSISYVKIIAARVAVVLLTVCSAVYLGMLLLMAIQKLCFKVEPEVMVYLYNYTIITLLPILFAVLISSGLYLIWDSVDLSILIMGVLFWLSLSGSHYLICWAVPWTPVFSDFAGINPVGKLVIYNRLLWACLSASLFLSGLLFRRCYGFTCLTSFRRNTERMGLVAAAIGFIALSAVLLIKEPYMSKGNVLNDYKEQINKKIELQKLYQEVNLKTANKELIGRTGYSFSNKEKHQEIQFLVNEGLRFKEIKVNNKPARYKRKNERNILVDIAGLENPVVEISYDGTIKYDSPTGMAGYIDKESVYLLENANWLPIPLTGVKSQMETTGMITAPRDLVVVTPGKLTAEHEKGVLKEWHYVLKSSSVSLGIFAGKYHKVLLKAGDVSVEFYYSKKHEAYIKNVGIEKYITKMITYYSNTFGRYPSKEYPLKIAETAIYKPGGHSSANIVTIAEYMFNRENSAMPAENNALLIHDLEIIAHEISHQWWGSGVETRAETLWSNEGLANYAAYKFLEQDFKEQSLYNVLGTWEAEAAKHKQSYYARYPEKIKTLSKSYQKAMEAENLKVNLYDIMPMMLLQGEKYLGEERFLQRLAKVYEKYLYKNLSYEDFLEEMKLTKEVMTIE